MITIEFNGYFFQTKIPRNDITKTIQFFSSDADAGLSLKISPYHI